MDGLELMEKELWDDGVEWRLSPGLILAKRGEEVKTDGGADKLYTRKNYDTRQKENKMK